MPKTVEEISKATGFSKTTIRFVIGGQAERYRISARTQQKIEDYIAIHGYSLNHAARSLKRKRSETIGFVVPDLANAFFARLMAELEVLCRKHNLLLLTIATHELPELEDRAIATLLSRGVDGLVLAPCQEKLLPLVEVARQRSAIVMVDRDYGHTQFPTVVSDNFQGALDMAREMLRVGARDGYFLCGHADSPSIQDRIRGFTEACRESGVADSSRRVLLSAEDSPAAGRQLMQQLIAALQGGPAAFMCSSLLLLEGALQQLRLQCGRIAPDIVIGTFDDHAMLDLLPNRVLSVRQDESGLAGAIVRRLLGARAEGSAAQVRDTVSCQLIRRNF